MTNTFKPFPKLSTTRLCLRQLTPLDAPEILYLRSNEIINLYIHRPEHEKIKNLTAAQEFIQNINHGIEKGEWLFWSINENGQTKTIGTICLWNFSDKNPNLVGTGSTADVGYDLALNHQGKGIMREALQAVLRYGFNKLELQKIEAHTHQENSASIKLLLSQGFVRDKKKKEVLHSDNLKFELIRESWLQAN